LYKELMMRNKIALLFGLFLLFAGLNGLMLSCSDNTTTGTIDDPQDTTQVSSADIDGDGIPNSEDTDIDGDGQLNSVDPDMDGDGIPNRDDRDMDADGLANDIDDTDTEDDPDMDADKTPNEQDMDMDGDMVDNSIDGDIDGDGLSNSVDPDMDGDDIANSEDPDMDGDGIANIDDPDANANGVNDVDEMKKDIPIAEGDIDKDGIPNAEDPDMDGDGILNENDADADNDLILDIRDTILGDTSSILVTMDPIVIRGDLDNDGVWNNADPDMDGDGILNTEDPDVDNDGIPNGDDPISGNITLPNPNAAIMNGDLDHDGIANIADTDIDGDGILNINDPDIDNDNVPATEDVLIGDLPLYPDDTLNSPDTNIVGQCFYGDPGDPILGDSIPLVKIIHRINGDNLELIVIFTPKFVDNSYGVNGIGWNPNRPHTLARDLEGSDHVELSLLNGGGTQIFHLRLDLISFVDSTVSGYDALGPFGGDGSLIVGSAEDIVSYTTSLDENLNDYGYVTGPDSPVLTDSPETDSVYTPNPAYPRWDFNVVYHLTVKLSAFGSSGFGTASMTSVHASPSKTPIETILVTEGECPPTASLDDPFRHTLVYQDPLWID
jgi:hypothetical protein